MTDPALFDMLHGGNNLKNKRQVAASVLSDAPSTGPSFDGAIEKSITAYVDNAMKEDDPNYSKFLSKSGRREKIEKEIREALDFSETGELIVSAMKILVRDGHSYLSNQDYQLLMLEIEKLHDQIDAVEFEQLSDESFKAIFTMAESCYDLIFRISISKFNEGLLPDSLALLTLLSNLKPEDADYIYRLGLIAQKSERFDLALRAYTIACSLDSQFLAPRLFAAECYLSCSQLEKARQALEEAREIIKIANVDPEWIELLTEIESILTEKKPL